MSPEFHEKVRRIFDEALELPKPKRARFLEFACADSPDVQKEVARLLEAQEPQNQPGAGAPNRAASNRGANDIPSLTRYKIQRELGRGAAGAVYEAVDQVIGRTVALKVLLSNSLSDPAETKSLEERLFREASSAGRLAHPGIVTVYDVGKEGDLAYIAMERVDGPTLQKMMREGKMDRTKALDILRQAASALDYAHAEGIIHRDIKPANIMLHRSVQAKIADFGIAKVSTMNQLTVAGTILGTPSYMSPEQIQNFPLTGRSDQFSLAVVAFELLTGARPFERDTVAALLMSIVTGQRPPASSTDPTLPKMVDEVLFMAMSREPDARFATCTAFVNALAGASGTETSTPVAAPPVSTMPPAAPPPPPSQMETAANLTPPKGMPPLPPPPPQPMAQPQAPHQPWQAVQPQAAQPTKKSNLGLYIVLGLIAVLLAAAWPVYKYIYPRPIAETTPKNQDAPKDKEIVIAPVETKPGAPAVSLFTAEPDQVQPGTIATLRWWVTDAAEVVINQDIGKVAGKGSVEVKPQKDTEYILTATGPGGEATAKVTIAVGKSAPNNKPLTTGTGATSGGDKAPPKPPPVVVDSAQAQKLYDDGVAKHRAGSGADAISLFQQAAGMGEPRAMLELGKMYSAGDGVGKDAAEAARWYRKAADLGNASAMVFLGALYVQGAGVPKDLGEAAKWIRKSADSGNAIAMDGLGQMYNNGQGVPTDAAQAVTWYRKAIDAGNAAAMYHLGLLLENGSGPVAKNAAEAAQLYQRAASAGYAPAKAKVAQGGGSLTLTAIDPGSIAVLKSQIYKLTGSGFSANTTVRTDVSSSIGSRQGEASNFHPVAVSPDGTWLKIFISVPPPDGRNTVKLIAKNPGGTEVTLDVPIQR
jgi:serine/threonine-protein kinase